MPEHRRESGEGWWARLYRPLKEELQRRRLKKFVAAYDQALAVWTGEENRLRELLETARTFRGYTGSELVHRGYEVPIVVKRNERIVYFERAASLVETKRQHGKYVGGYAGFSFRVVKSVRLHAGGRRGTYIPGPETSQIVDQGIAAITTQRIVFKGQKQTREWLISRLVGYDHHPAGPMTTFHVSNRDRAAGVIYEDADQFRSRLELAVALFNGTVKTLIQSLENEVEQHRAGRPQPPGELPSGSELVQRSS